MNETQHVDPAATPGPEPADAQHGTDDGIVAAIAGYPANTLLYEDAMSRIFGRHPVSVRRAVERGELPAPFRMFGRNAWLAGAIVEHWQQQQDAASRQRDELQAKVEQMAP